MQNECSKPRSEKHESATTAAHSIGQYRDENQGDRGTHSESVAQRRLGTGLEICGIPGSTNGPTAITISLPTGGTPARPYSSAREELERVLSPRPSPLITRPSFSARAVSKKTKRRARRQASHTCKRPSTPGVSYSLSWTAISPCNPSQASWDIFNVGNDHSAKRILVRNPIWSEAVQLNSWKAWSTILLLASNVDESL